MIPRIGFRAVSSQFCRNLLPCFKETPAPFLTRQLSALDNSSESLSPDKSKYLQEVNSEMVSHLQRRRAKLRSIAQDLLLDGYSFTPDIYRTLIGAATRDNNLQEVLSLLNQMKIQGLKPMVGFYNLVLRAAIVCKNLDVAFSVHEEMVANKIILSLSTYQALLLGCSQNGDLTRAHKVVALMERSRMKHNPDTAASLISCYANAPHLQSRGGADVTDRMAADRTAALEECKMMLENSRNFDTRGFAPHPTFHAMLGVCVALEDYPHALGMIASMAKEDLQVDEDTMHHLCTMYMKQGDFNMARDTLLEIRNKGVRPKLDTYMDIMEAVLRSRSPECVDQFMSVHECFYTDRYKLREETVRTLFPLALHPKLGSLDAAHEIWSEVVYTGLIPSVNNCLAYLNALNQRAPHLTHRIKNVKKVLNIIQFHHEERAFVYEFKDSRFGPSKNHMRSKERSQLI